MTDIIVSNKRIISFAALTWRFRLRLRVSYGNVDMVLSVK